MKFTIKAIIITTMFLSLGTLISAAPVNDNWQNAILMTTNNVSGTVAGATLQPCESTDHEYPDEGWSGAHNTVWYKWIAPSNGSFTFTAVNIDGMDPVLSAYRFAQGTCNGLPAAMPNKIVENHNYNHDLGFAGDSKISFRVTAGELIYLAVDSYSPSITGQFVLGVTKTRFRHDASLDHKNGGADLVIDRPTSTVKEWWMARYGSQTYFAAQQGMAWGYGSDTSFMADFDGDRISDLVSIRKTPTALYWFVATRTGQMIRAVPWGLNTDTPVVGDYDGDGIADIGVTRDDTATNTKTWHILRSKDGQYMATQFGQADDWEMAGDYDGDGRTDIVVLRPENGSLTWHILQSNTTQVMSRVFGYSHGGDIPVVADFDGDLKTDIAVFRMTHLTTEYNGYWFSIDSSDPLPLDQKPIRAQQFGQTNDRPQAADFDGDQKTDLAVVRAGVWWIRSSKFGTVKAHQWGYASDKPMSDGGMYISQILN